MTQYLIIFLIITGVYPLLKYFRRKNPLIIFDETRLYILVITLILIIISGLRGTSVGIDTAFYHTAFEQAKTSSFWQLFSGSELEAGYVLLQFLVAHVFGEFQILVLIISVFYLTTVSSLIAKYSINPVLSYILFLGLGLFSFSLSAMRQTIALTLTLIAFSFIKEKALGKFLLMISCAAMFHLSSVIFLPAYFICMINGETARGKKIIAGLALLLVFGLIFKDQTVDVLNRLARIGYEPTATGGDRMLLLLVFTLLLGILFKKPLVAQNPDNKLLLFMIAASAAIFPFTQFNPVIIRLNYFYFFFIIIFVPNVLGQIKDIKLRSLGAVGYALTAAIWFFTVRIAVEKLETYVFFWQNT